MKRIKTGALLLALILTLVYTINVSAASDTGIGAVLGLKSQIVENNKRVSAKEQAVENTYKDTLTSIEEMKANPDKITEEKKQAITDTCIRLKAYRTEISTYSTELKKLQEEAKAAKDNGDVEGAANCLKKILEWQQKWMQHLDELNNLMQGIRG